MNEEENRSIRDPLFVIEVPVFQKLSPLIDSIMASSRKVLVTGATGKQGGAVINALLASPAASSFQILAVTRNPESGSAKAVVSKSPNIKIVKGDLDDCEGIFREAGEGIDSAFLVTFPQIQKVEQIQEEKQGKDFVDAAVAHGVKHFVFTSVDRGARSDSDPTYVPHFISKYNIELHLKEKAASSGMIYTIFRPVAFVDNFQPDFAGKGMATMLYQMGEKRLQLVSVKDIGIFAAMAFTHPEGFKNRSLSLAGDELNYKEASEVFHKVYGRPLPTTFSLLTTLMRWVVKDVGLMVKWFEEVGFTADIAECKRINPGMLNFESWLKEESKHQA